MNNVGFVLPLLPLADWAAVLWYFVVWIGYAMFADRLSVTQPSLLVAGQHTRTQWMLETTYRDQRVIDAVVIQNLTSSPSFFASTTILIVGGLLAILGTTEQTTAVVSELPFAARTTALVFDLKVLLLAATFVYAFFRFTWSLRQYNFGAQVVASAPAPERFAQAGDEARAQFAQRGAGILGLAAEAFNDGLRAYYMAFSGVAWFFSPLAFAVASTLVVVVLYQREFRSQALMLLRDR